jgi:hypothetical protein
MKPLVIPPAAQRDDNAIQMLSAWIAENGLHCSLNIGMWDAQGLNEAKSWGILLADVVRHIANAIESEHGIDKSETATEIAESFLDELNYPTSDTSGDFHPGHS